MAPRAKAKTSPANLGEFKAHLLRLRAFNEGAPASPSVATMLKDLELSATRLVEEMEGDEGLSKNDYDTLGADAK